MARFRATIQGSRGEASRLGDAKHGIQTTTNGWHSGIRVSGGTDDDDADVLYVHMTGGSSPRFNEQFLGTVRLVDGKPTWEPA